ncbi:MAG: flagellar hook-associated protein FlgK, partial [Clostridia bacterium]|nr:flagellar hook-associated protein FlgK [Clostridia bacterium]
MPSTFGGLYISLRAMQAQQRALETSSHNIANATTPGFSRQRAVMATTIP